MPKDTSPLKSLNALVVRTAAVDVLLSQAVLRASYLSQDQVGAAELLPLQQVFMKRLLGSAAVMRGEVAGSNLLHDKDLTAADKNQEILKAEEDARQFLAKDCPDVAGAIQALINRFVA